MHYATENWTMANGFSREETAELLGDTVLVSKIYARIASKQLEIAVKKRLKWYNFQEQSRNIY